MPHKNKADYNAYMAEYMKQKYDRLINEAVIFLGGKCVTCGDTENLQFDHIDRKTKLATVTSLTTKSKHVFWTEVKKCQLLCIECHRLKSEQDGSYDPIYKEYKCSCGREFNTNKSYSGHKRYCKHVHIAQ